MVTPLLFFCMTVDLNPLNVGKFVFANRVVGQCKSLSDCFVNCTTTVNNFRCLSVNSPELFFGHNIRFFH